jgi:hypothetical protein
VAISTYAELQTAIQNYGHRSDTTFTDRATEFIALAEARLNDLHLLHNYESEESLTLTTGVNYVAVPSGYISPIALWLIVSGERVLLDPALPQELPYDTDNGQPKYWAIDGANIRFDCPADSGYSGKFRMLKSSNLSGTNTTNALLTRRPDIYLAACMVEAARWARDDKLFGIYEPQFLQGVRQLKIADNRAKAMAPLRSDLAGRGRSNIFTGE